MDIFEQLKNWAVSQGMSLSSKLLVGAILGGLGILVIRFVLEIITKAMEKSKLEKAAHTLIKSLARAVMYLLLALIVASSLGIDVTGVVALASVLTLAISLSVQNALTNVIGGFTLLSTKPFQTGDFVEIAGQSGTVQTIGMTYTQLTTGDNKTISIPNSSVVATQIINYTTLGTRRVDIVVSASYDCAVDAVLEALKEAAAIPTALDTPAPFAAVKNYGESAIEYVLQIWCNADNYWPTLFDGNKKVKEVFDARGIAMTYPHINVHLDK